MKIRKVVCMLTLSTLLVSGCTSYQKSLYLQNEQVLNESLEGQLYDFRIMPKDELTIVVSTTDPEASAPFYRKIGQNKEFSNSGEFYQFNLSSCIRQQNSLTAQFVSFSLANLANIFYPPRFLQ